MPELIERETLKNHLYRSQAEAFKRSEWYVAGSIQSFIDLLDKQPTIEPEVRHGRWIVNTTWNGMFGLIHSECSECKFDRNGDLSSWKFCQNCGARMDATDKNVGGKGGADNG